MKKALPQGAGQNGLQGRYLLGGVLHLPLLDIATENELQVENALSWQSLCVSSNAMSEIKNVYEQLPQDSAPSGLVILLHGLGSNGRDLISLSPYFAAAGKEIGFISPDAPFACDMAPPGYPDSYQWFSLQSREPHDMLQGVETAFPILKSFIEEQADKFDLPLSKIALCGFSQGTMMSLYTATRMNEPMAGVLGYSGAMIGALGEHKLPVRLVHGQADDVVPVAAYTHARETLEAAGYDVSGHTTPGLQHSIDEQGIRTGIEFLTQVMGA